MVSYSRFETVLGVCGIDWSEVGIVRLQLPEGTVRRTEVRVAGEDGRPAQPPSHVQDVIRGLQAHISGEVQSFQQVSLDLSQQGRATGPPRARPARGGEGPPCT
ncbi:MAG: hypothetical protein ACYCW6_20895 [Candidatus Xenobia bacterium]